MSWLSKAYRKVAKLDPTNKVLNAAGVSKSNTFRQLINPTATLHQQAADGKPLTWNNVADPGHVWSEETYAKPPPKNYGMNARDVIAMQMQKNPPQGPVGQSIARAAAPYQGGALTGMAPAPGQLSAPPMQQPAPQQQNYGDIAAIQQYVMGRRRP